MTSPSDILDAFASITTWKRGGQRAPHKPLLVLLALARLQRGEERLVAFDEVEEPLRKLLVTFGPTRSSHHPEYPFWRLQSDHLWAVPGGEALRSRRSNKDPPVTELRKVSGGFPEAIDQQLRDRPTLLRDIAGQILDEHFPPSLHDDLLAAVGLSLEEVKLTRDPKFRDLVLNAYGHRCGVCGIDPHLDGMVTGLEAAHVRWHKHAGPSTVDNGIAMCPTHHKSFDIGLIGLDEDRRVIVSTRLHGGKQVEEFLGRSGADGAVARAARCRRASPALAPQAGVQAACTADRRVTWPPCEGRRRHLVDSVHGLLRRSSPPA